MSRKVKVMFSIAGLHHGGAERVIASLCDHIDQDRFDISVCWWAGVGAIGEELKARGVELVGLREIDPDVSPYMRFRVLKQLCKERSVDVIHTHDTGTLADAAQARLFGSKAKIVHTFHFGNYPHLARKYLAMEIIFSRFAHRLVAVGHEQAKLVQKSLKIRPGKLITLYNGVEHVVPDPESDFALDSGAGAGAGDDGPVILGSISTLTRQKGLPILLDAASLLSQMQRNFLLLIVGGGPMQSELEQQAESLGIADRVRFLGWVPNAARQVLHLFDVFCQSSLWEANSIVLLEAMSAGVPIVTTNVGESLHVIGDGKDGRVVPPNDAVKLAEAMAGLIDDTVQRRAMGSSAKAKFERSYTVDKMVKNYESIYAELEKTGA
jgi:glycosyltransferase involved in cell wall biosynthesis